MPLRFWRDWMLLWAGVPVVSSVFWMALGKEIDKASPYASLHWWGTLVAVLLSILVFAVGPYIALKRHFHRNFGVAYIGIMISICISLIAWTQYGNTEWIREIDAGFPRVLFSYKSSFTNLLLLPWWRVALISCLKGITQYAIPVAILCLATRKYSSYFIALLFVLLGCFAAEVGERLFYLTGVLQLNSGTLNGIAWSFRLTTIMLWSAASMIGASVSAVGMCKLLPEQVNGGERDHAIQRKINSSVLTTGTIALLLGGPIVMSYVLGPNGISSGFPLLRYALSSAPTKDVSSGREILQFSQKIDTHSYKWPNPFYADIGLSPDGKYLLVLEQEDQGAAQWSVFDMLTGARLYKLGERLANGGRSSLLWTSDGKYLVINRRGKEHNIGIGTEYWTQLDLYSLEDFFQKVVTVPVHDGCLHRSILTKVMFETDKGTLMLVCDPPAQEGDLLAVEFSLPKLEEKHLRYVSHEEAGHNIRLSFEKEGTVYAAMQPRPGADRFLIANLSSDEESVVLNDPLAQDRGGKLTFQRFGFSQDRPTSLGIKLCGGVDSVSNPPNHKTQTSWGSSFCRLLRYSLNTGAFLNYQDLPETRGIISKDDAQHFSLKTKDWEITGEAKSSSKTGKLVIRDISSGRIIQTIHTTTRIPLQISDDGTQLFTLDATDRTIAVYHLRENQNRLGN